MIKYSPSAKTFFDFACRDYQNVPADAVEVSDEQRQQQLGGTLEITVVDGQVVLATPQRSTEQLWADFRSKRARLLASSDWTQVADAAARCDQAAWAAWRQTLCDIPQTQNDPSNIQWPDPPAN